MQAITTKYHGPGNVRGSRISARADSGRLYLHYDDSLNSAENHRAAAVAYCRKYGWIGTLEAGQTYRGEYVWVFSGNPWTVTAEVPA